MKKNLKYQNYLTKPVNLKGIIRRGTRTPDGWTSTVVPLGNHPVMFLKPDKKQLKSTILSQTPHGEMPKKKPGTLSRILDNIDKMSADDSKKKYFDFDVSDFARFDAPNSGYDSAAALDRNLNFGVPEKSKKHKNNRDD